MIKMLELLQTVCAFAFALGMLVTIHELGTLFCCPLMWGKSVALLDWHGKSDLFPAFWRRPNRMGVVDLAAWRLRKDVGCT